MSSLADHSFIAYDQLTRGARPVVIKEIAFRDGFEAAERRITARNSLPGSQAPQTRNKIAKRNCIYLFSFRIRVSVVIRRPMASL